MRLVVDANVILSALIADSTTRELLVTLDPTLLTPETVHEELERYEPLVVEKSGIDTQLLQQFVRLLFEHIQTIPAQDFHPHIDRAETALGETDPDDVLNLACAHPRARQQF